MSVEETIEVQAQARQSLIICAHYMRERDNLIRHARSVGVSITEIARILRMNRGHVSVIANQTPDGPRRASEGNAARPTPEG